MYCIGLHLLWYKSIVAKLIILQIAHFIVTAFKKVRKTGSLAKLGYNRQVGGQISLVMAMYI
jgi:hypothetical protein